LIVRLTHPQQATRFARELHGLFVDFLARAHEPFSVEQQWAALLASLGQPHILFLVGFNDRMRPVGYLLAQSGADWWGVQFANVIQLYTTPGTPREIVDEFDQHVERWADERNTQIVSGLTNRNGPGYERWMRKRGFHRGPTMYYRVRDHGKTTELAN
jgi:hypothetical protein